jgi:hypothetical protein
LLQNFPAEALPQLGHVVVVVVVTSLPLTSGCQEGPLRPDGHGTVRKTQFQPKERRKHMGKA